MSNTRTAAKPSDELESEPARPKILGRTEILDAPDLNTETVEVKEWGGAVIVRSMTGSERDAYEGDIFSLRGQGKGLEYNLTNIRAKLCARTIVDESGDRIFTDSDILKLGMKSAAALDKVFAVAQRLSRLTQADVQDLAEQMGNDPSAASGSA